MARRGRIIGCALALLGLFAALPPSPAGGQAPASLIADQVSYDRETGLLVASGNVEVLYQGRVLRAERITYDERADEIRAAGPLVLTDPDGGVLLAESAAMTPDLTAGLVQGARLLIAEKLQLAAAEVRRTGGRYTTLYRTVASSCTICAGNPTPTWALRAARVTQDAEARRIYFEDARLEVFGLPVGYLPRLSIPEPTVRRASGVLVPSFLSSDIFGFGFKLPYYRVLGPSADTTITPFLTTTGASLIEGEYRQRFAGGGFDISGVIALDDGLGGGFGRGAMSAVGSFGLGRGFVSDFDLNLASDDDFLAQFDYSDTDQLTSTASVHRTRENEFIELGSIAFQSLRDDEDTSTVPFILPEFTARRLFATPRFGGRLGIDLDTLGVLRELGQDVFRAGGGVDWRRGWVLPRGLLADATASAGVEAYRTWNDPDLPETIQVRTSPTVAVELRWPLVNARGRAAHVIEPAAQVAYTGTLGAGDDDIPNEDSLLPEFDETNLFSLDRFPGLDRIETGLRANLGLSYTRYDPAGWSLGLTVGRVLHAEPVEGFSESTGLAGRWSDYVAALSLDFDWGLSLLNRAMLDNDLTFQRNELAVAYDGQRGDLRAAYIFLAEQDDPTFGPQPETEEFALDARYRFHPNWELRGLWRYDVATNSNLRAGGALSYGNECAEIDLSVSRRYTSSSNVPPSTSIGFDVRLAGLGSDGDWDWPERVCTLRGL